MKKFLCILLVLFSFSFAFAKEDKWTQEKFTDLVTFLYTDGEAIVTAYGDTLYNISMTISEDGSLVVHFGLFPSEEIVILTIEKTEFKEDGGRIVDHDFFYSYFSTDIGTYYYLPARVTTNHIILSAENVLEDMTSDVKKEYKFEGYEDEDWLFWMNVYYEYMQTQKAKGRST